MEHKVRVLPPKVLMEQLLAVMEEAQTVPLIISGNSMSPFLVHGRDTVYLSKITSPLKKGDMILYRRDSGDYILHRICRVEGETFCLVGDAQVQLEHGIRRDQVLAIVTAVRRKGTLLQRGSFWWEFFEKIWLRLIPLRRVLIGLYARVTRRGGREKVDD